MNGLNQPYCQVNGIHKLVLNGLTKGISGTTKYGDNAYSVRRKYDTATQTFTTYYYYWVKDKTTLPAIETRRTSGFNIAQAISDPATAGTRFLAPLGSNRFSLYNCQAFMQDKNVGVSFNWWTIENPRTK